MDSADFRPTASLSNLQRRAGLLRVVRHFFEQRDFLEVETPLLSADTVVDRHLDPLSVILFSDPRSPDDGPRRWLQTSPEFCMKRLLAAGHTAIFQLAKAFRGGEQGAKHNPEFTMLEWYRVGDDYAAGMQLLDELAAATLQRGSAERLSYREAFRRHAQLDPAQASTQELIQAARQHGLHASWEAADRELWLDGLLSICVAPQLGRTRPTILYDYPASQAALAQVRDEAFPVAERFELFVDGVELANGYHELLDPHVLRTRQEVANQARRTDGKFTLPEDNRLLAAMQQGLPPCTGVALGFDRLVMVALGAASLSEVLAFPADRA